MDNKNKPLLVVMCGLQASGKSTKAQELAKGLEHTIIVSSDLLRNSYPTYGNDKIFRELYNIVNQNLALGNNVIIDATNTTIKSRKQVFLNIKNDCKKICYIMNTPYEECLIRLEKRNNDPYKTHTVPEEALKRYYYSFEVPFYEEGWDEIKLNIHSSHYEADEYIKGELDKAKDFNQNNKHHTQLLGKHLESVGKALKKGSNLAIAGYFHDLGKLYTQTYKEGDSNAHYYSHANVGAYNLLCNYLIWDETNKDRSISIPKIDDALEVIFYVNYHMQMYNLDTDKSIDKWKKTFGEEKFNNLLLLNEADKKGGKK